MLVSRPNCPSSGLVLWGEVAGKPGLHRAHRHRELSHTQEWRRKRPSGEQELIEMEQSARLHAATLIARTTSTSQGTRLAAH